MACIYGVEQDCSECGMCKKKSDDTKMVNRNNEKVAFIMEKPKCCGECKMSGTSICRKWNMKDMKVFPKDCPLKQIPQQMAEENRWFSEDYAQGYNACIREILGERDKQ